MDHQIDYPARSLVIDGGGACKDRDDVVVVVSLVDPFIVEALENPRHRLTVLRMELDIQRFMQNSDQYQFEFQHFPTSYLRRAAHRVAQHYGLQTIALDNTVDGLGGRIIARKTTDSRFPAICLSDIPAKQSEKEISEKVKIAIRPKPSKGLLSDSFELGNKGATARTVEERKEEYDKARARIFSGSNSPDIEGFLLTSADGRSSCSTVDEQESFRAVEEIEKIIAKDGASRVAIFRDREKDRTDPDYDRSYDRYVRGLPPIQSFGLGGCSVLQPPFVLYEPGYSQMGQFPSNLPSAGYSPSNPSMKPFCTFGCNQTSKDAVFMQWPNHAMMYAQHSYETFRHAVFQVPFYQQPLSLEHSQNC